MLSDAIAMLDRRPFEAQASKMQNGRMDYSVEWSCYGVQAATVEKALEAYQRKCLREHGNGVEPNVPAGAEPELRELPLLNVFWYGYPTPVTFRRVSGGDRDEGRAR